MTIEQTVTIPADHRVFFDFPREIPVGKARVEVKVTPVVEEPAEREPSDLPSEDQKAEASDPSVDKTAFPKHAKCMEYWKKTYPPAIVEMLSTPSPLVEKLAGCFANAGFGDKTYEQLRDEWLAEKYGV